MKLTLSADEEVARGRITTALLTGGRLAAGRPRQRIGVIVVHISGFSEENRQRLFHHVASFQSLCVEEGEGE